MLPLTYLVYAQQLPFAAPVYSVIHEGIARVVEHGTEQTRHHSSTKRLLMLKKQQSAYLQAQSQADAISKPLPFVRFV